MRRKNMLSQKIYKLLGITVLIAVLLSACGPAATATQAVEPPGTSAPEATSAATEAPAATEAATEAAAKPSGTVTLWMWKAAHDTLINSGVLDEFAKEYPDIKVEIVEYAPADVYQKLPLASRRAPVHPISRSWKTVTSPKLFPWAA